MSRLIASSVINGFLVRQATRTAIRLCSKPRFYFHKIDVTQQQLNQKLNFVPQRFLASWGADRPPVDPKEIELRVFKSLSTHDKIDPNQIKTTSHLQNDLGLDSLDQVEIMVALEDEFDISIEDVDAEKLFTVKDIIEFVIKYLETRPDPRQNPGAKYDPNMDFGPQ